MGLFNRNKEEHEKVCNARQTLNDKLSQLDTFLDDNKCIQHVILIDDDETSNYVAETTLKSHGLTDKISIFDNAQDALTFIKELKESGEKMPDMIFLDIKMPLMNGFQFLDQCNSFCDIEKETKVIVLSSSSYSQDKEKALNRGLEYITKPLQMDKLDKVIEK
jgi:two-component SAPR family response regulator